MGTFKTLSTNSISFYKEKGSKFYGYAFPLNNLEEQKQFLTEIVAEHPKARHICTALLLGSGDDEYYLLNDDGEPAHSAASPMLGQIRSNEITNVFLAVVRYFGGTKLGIAGLIAAYKETAAAAIENNRIIEVEPKSKLSFELSYPQLGEILSILDRNNLSFNQNSHSKGITIDISVKEIEIEEVKAYFNRYDFEIKLG